MQRITQALLFCAVLVSVASGLQPQMRFMNAQFNNNTITLTTTPYNITNALSLFGSYFGFPSTYYATLPSPIYGSLNVPQTFYATQGYGNARANVTVTLNDAQSYSFVYVAQSNPQFFDTDIGSYVPTTNFPVARLFAFEETPSYVGTVLKIVNTAVSSYSYGYLQVSCSFYGTYDVPFGGSTDFIDVLPNEYIELVFFSPNSNKNVTAWIYTANATSTVVYLRGDVSSPFDLTYDITSIFLDNQQSSYPPVYPQEPVAAPISAPNNALPWPRVRFLDSATPTNLSVLAVFDQNYNLLYNNTAMWKSEYQYICQGAGNYYLAFTSQLIAGSWYYYLRPGQSVTVLQTAFSGVQFVNDYPENYTASFSYVQVVYNVKDYYATAWCTLSTPSWVNQNFLGYFSIWGFNQVDAGWSNIQCQIGDSTVNTDVFISSGVATTIYIFGESYAPYFFVDSQPLPVVEPVCVNGYLESNGICNCYSGYFTDDSSPYKCAMSNSYCSWNNQSDALSNDYIPYINWWNNPYVYGDQLYFTITSDLVSGRRTLIELPNPQCNFLNRPQYFQKINGGCYDAFNVQIPFVDCGFTKISTPNEDFYKGTVHVKQIDRVTVGGVTTDRVIDTPFPISIRMPKQLAVESSVQVFGPPSLAIDAAFVGQTMNTDTQSGNLQYVSAVQYPLQIEQVQLVDLPYGVYAWVELVNVNCTDFGPCVQRLELHINTTNCYISGTYRMVVSLSCRSDQGCPDEAKNGTQAFIESRIVSQSLCSEVGVDIDLNGYIQAFTDPSFSSVALAFYPGQSAYFMINAYSSRVSLSSVRLESVYYYGPNINYQYLYINGNTTDIASSSNFVSGSRGNSQAWFGVDVSVSTPQSGDNTLFKLYQGQNGVYNFVAIVDVEWSVNTSSSVTPVGPPVEASNQPVEANVPFSFKKRMALQGSVLNQGSQFTAQVQIAGPTPSSQQQPPQQQPRSQQTPVSSSNPDDKLGKKCGDESWFNITTLRYGNSASCIDLMTEHVESILASRSLNYPRQGDDLLEGSLAEHFHIRIRKFSRRTCCRVAKEETMVTIRVTTRPQVTPK